MEAETLSPAEPAPHFAVDSLIFGRYKVERVVAGRLGPVYLTYDQFQYNHFVIKALDIQLVQIASTANHLPWTDLGIHPHIASCYYLQMINTIPHIVIQHVDGGDLFRWIKAKRCLDYLDGIDLAMQGCRGMLWAHSQQISHGDLRPENILLTKSGVVKLTNFGLRRQDAATDTKNLGNQFFDAIGWHGGAPPDIKQMYVPPECLHSHHGSKDYPGDSACNIDLYSYGVCLWQLFCNQMPYQPNQITAFIANRKMQPSPDPREIRGDIPVGLRDVLMQCVALDVHKRTPDFQALLTGLENCYQQCYNQTPNTYQLERGYTRADAINNRGYAALEIGDSAQACELFTQALQIDSAHLQARFNRALCQRQAGAMQGDVLADLREYADAENTHTNTLNLLCARITYDRFESAELDKQLGPLAHQSKLYFPEQQPPHLQAIGELEGHTDVITCLQVKANMVISAAKDNTLRRWDAQTRECIYTLDGLTAFATGLALSRDSRVMLTSHGYDQLQLWDVETGQRLGSFEPYPDYISAVILLNDGEQAVSASVDNSLQIWDLQTRTLARWLSEHTAPVLTIVQGSTSNLLFSGSGDASIKIWDIEQGTCIRTLNGHEDVIYSVALTADDNYLVSASEDNTCRLWDWRTGECLRVFSSPNDAVIAGLASSDNRFILAGSWSGAVVAWSRYSSHCIGIEQAHAGFITNIKAWGDDCIITTGRDQSIKIWDISSFKLNAAKSQLVQLQDIALEDAKLQHIISLALEYFDTDDYQNAWIVLLAGWWQIDFDHKHVVIRTLYDQIFAITAQHDPLLYYKMLLCQRYIHYTEPLDLHHGRFVVSGSADNSICLYDGKTGACLHSFTGHSFSVEAVAVSDNGRLVVSGGFDNNVIIWDIATRQMLTRLQAHTGSVLSVAISNDSEYGLSSSKDNTIRLWHLASGECRQVLHTTTAYAQVVSFCSGVEFALSANGTNLLLWNIHTGQVIKTIVAHNDSIQAIAVSSDGKFAVSGGLDLQLKLWQIETGDCVAEMTAHTGAIHAVAISADGRMLASASSDRQVRLWEAKTGICMREFAGHRGSVNAVAFSKDGKSVFSGSWDKTVKKWDISSNKCVHTFTEHTGFVRCIATINDGNATFIAHGNRQLKLGIVAANDLFIQAKYADAWMTLRSVWNECDFADEHAAIQIYFNLLKKGRVNGIAGLCLKQILKGHRNGITAPSHPCHRGISASMHVTHIAISYDGKYIVSAGKDFGIKVWHLLSGDCLHSLLGHTAEIRCVTFNLNAQFVVSASADKTIKVWELANGECCHTLVDHNTTVSAVITSINGHSIYSADIDGMVKTWTLSSGNCEDSWQGHTAGIDAMAVSEDDHTLVCSGAETLYIWDITERICRHQGIGHSALITNIALTRDGRHVISASHDNTLKYWCIATGECQQTLTGHLGPVNAVALSTDGKFAWSGSDDMTIKVWDLGSGQCLLTNKQSQPITALAQSLDDCFLVCGFSDASLAIWRIIWDLDLPISLTSVVRDQHIDMPIITSISNVFANVGVTDHKTAVVNVNAVEPSHAIEQQNDIVQQDDRVKKQAVVKKKPASKKTAANKQQNGKTKLLGKQQSTAKKKQLNKHNQRTKPQMTIATARPMQRKESAPQSPDVAKDQIIEFMQTTGGHATFVEMAEHTGLSRDDIRQAVKLLVKEDRIETDIETYVSGGVWTLTKAE